MKAGHPTKPAAPLVTGDTQCARCGYNLRSLPVNGRCSECGLPVVTSLMMPAPEWADAPWVGRVRLGTIALLVGQVVLAAGVVALMVLRCDGEETARWVFAAALAIDGVGGALLVWPSNILSYDRRLSRY